MQSRDAVPPPQESSPKPEWKDAWVEGREALAEAHKLPEPSEVPPGAGPAKGRRHCVVLGLLVFSSFGLAAMLIASVKDLQPGRLADAISIVLPVVLAALPPLSVLGAVYGWRAYELNAGEAEMLTHGPSRSSSRTTDSVWDHVSLWPGLLLMVVVGMVVVVVIREDCERRWRGLCTALSAAVSLPASVGAMAMVLANWRREGRLVQSPPYRFQFSLRTLVLAVLAAGAYMGGLFFLFPR